MSIFSFGQKKTKTTDTTDQLGFGIDASAQGSFGQSFGQSFGGTFVDPRQQAALDFTRNLGMQSIGGLLGQVPQLAAQNQGLFQQGQQMLGGLGAGLEQFGNAQATAAQIGSLGQNVGAFLQNQVLPQIGRDAIAAGGFGGGRQSIAEGVAGGEAARAFTGGVANILQGADQQRLQAQQSLAQAQLGGLSMLPGLGGLLQSPFTTSQGLLGTLAGVIGAPTVLGQDMSQQGAFDTSFGRSFGFDFDQMQRRMTSTTKGFDFGIGAGFPGLPG